VSGPVMRGGDGGDDDDDDDDDEEEEEEEEVDKNDDTLERPASGQDCPPLVCGDSRLLSPRHYITIWSCVQTP
jgi:hypothetical protein